MPPAELNHGSREESPGCKEDTRFDLSKIRRALDLASSSLLSGGFGVELTEGSQGLSLGVIRGKGRLSAHLGFRPRRSGNQMRWEFSISVPSMIPQLERGILEAGEEPGGILSAFFEALTRVTAFLDEEDTARILHR